jgi:YD repeat-containing protein
MPRLPVSMGLIPVLFSVIALFPQTGHAVVDMKNANYSDSWLDLQFNGSGYALRVQRFYNSRSTFSGIFGFGWCSEFETAIEKTPEGRLKLVECGAGQETIYSPAKFDAKSMEKLIDQLVANYKKTTPGATEMGASTLREQLQQSADLRSEWAKHAGLSIPEVKKGVVYSADNLEVEKIVFDGTNYVRSIADGTAQRFDSAGRLVMMNDKNGNSLKLSYSGELLREIVDNTGKKLTFAFNQNKRVKEITGPGGAKAEYKFKGEDLVDVKNMWKNKYTYQYDETHNITRINFPDGTFKALAYNQKMDWVTSFTDRAIGGPACVETYKYEFSKSDPKNNFWSTALKKCGGEVKNDARFEFWHKTAPDGRKFLARVLTKTLTNTLDVTYHPTLGRPTLVKKDGIVTTFDYFSNGLVREKTTPNMRLAFEYKNDFNKVSKVETDFLDQKGKVVRKRSTGFTYDAKANLVAAQNSDGQSVRLTYDGRGRIATILDQAKKEVLVKWDDKSGKPAQITRPSVGTIKMTYKANGDINKVDSPDGPTVASQIAVTFNNLLDIIAPATSELNL